MKYTINPIEAVKFLAVFTDTNPKILSYLNLGNLKIANCLI